MIYFIIRSWWDENRLTQACICLLFWSLKTYIYTYTYAHTFRVLFFTILITKNSTNIYIYIWNRYKLIVAKLGCIDKRREWSERMKEAAKETLEHTKKHSMRGSCDYDNEIHKPEGWWGRGERIEANIKKKQQKLRYSKRGVEMKFDWTENEDYAKNHQHNGDEKHLVVYSRC